MERLSAAVIRNRLLLSVASEMVGAREGRWLHGQVLVQFRGEAGEDWGLGLAGASEPQNVEDVVAGRVAIATLNPSLLLTQAHRGIHPFRRPMPVRAIAVIPSRDRFGMAVRAETGLSSLAEVRERRYPLRLSLRGKRTHAVHGVLDQILEAAGFSLQDILNWGGQVRYDASLPNSPDRLALVERGEVDGLFDEAVGGFATPALQRGMRLLPLSEAEMSRLEAVGHRRAFISRADHPLLPADVLATDFSGWPIYTAAEAPDALVTAFCEGLAAAAPGIGWQGEGPLPLHRMCGGDPDAPLDVPLHPAAERVWRAHGWLR